MFKNSELIILNGYYFIIKNHQYFLKTGPAQEWSNSSGAVIQTLSE
jgi:hypothetical protein